MGCGLSSVQASARTWSFGKTFSLSLERLPAQGSILERWGETEEGGGRYEADWGQLLLQLNPVLFSAYCHSGSRNTFDYRQVIEVHMQVWTCSSARLSTLVHLLFHTEKRNGMDVASLLSFIPQLFFAGLRIWTQDLVHAMQTVHHWATSLAHKCLMKDSGCARY